MTQVSALAIEGTWEPTQAQPLFFFGSGPLCTSCISQRLISTVCLPLMRTQVCLVKTAHLSTAHTEGEMGPCYTPPWGFASPQGCWGNRPAAHTAEWDGPGWKEGMSALNKWAKGEWWDRSDGVLFGLAPSMAHWQVTSFGSTCALIRFQENAAGTVEPLHTAAVGQSQLRQTWGRSAASPTAWRSKTSKVTGGFIFLKTAAQWLLKLRDYLGLICSMLI